MQPNQTIINYFSLSLQITQLTVITIFETTIDNNNYYRFVLCKDKDTIQEKNNLIKLTHLWNLNTGKFCIGGGGLYHNHRSFKG